MSASLWGGPVVWEGGRDDEGHRDYSITFMVKTTTRADGPETVMNCPGLPAVGTFWVLGNDSDVYATVTQYMKASLHQAKQGDGIWWTVEMKATTRPLKRCNDTSIENPVNEPTKISGSFMTEKREATKDRNGDPIRNSAYELIKGPGVEFDEGKPTVKISYNTATLDLPLLAEFMDPPHVNDSTLWGLAARCIKVARIDWERKYWASCSVYYTLSMEFDIKYNTHDRDVLDDGYRHLAAKAKLDSPRSYVVYKDKKGENARCILDGYGCLWHGSLASTAFVNLSTSTAQVTFPDGHGLVKNDTLSIVWSGGERHAMYVDQLGTDGPIPGLAAQDIIIRGGEGDNLPATSTVVSAAPAGFNHIEKYPEGNLLLLGIPSSLT